MPEQMSHLFENLRSDLRNLDPAVHGEGLAAATEYALDDLRSIEEQFEAVCQTLAWYAEWRNYRWALGDDREHTEADCPVFARDAWLGGQPGSRARAALTQAGRSWGEASSPASRSSDG